MKRFGVLALALSLSLSFNSVVPSVLSGPPLAIAAEKADLLDINTDKIKDQVVAKQK